MLEVWRLWACKKWLRFITSHNGLRIDCGLGMELCVCVCVCVDEFVDFLGWGLIAKTDSLWWWWGVNVWKWHWLKECLSTLWYCFHFSSLADSDYFDPLVPFVAYDDENFYSNMKCMTLAKALTLAQYLVESACWFHWWHCWAASFRIKYFQVVDCLLGFLLLRFQYLAFWTIFKAVPSYADLIGNEFF